MAKYLVECSCGNKMPVDVGQAGGRVTCSCGNQLEVPQLRKLRHLPVAAAESRVTAASRWGARQGVITASLIALAALVAAVIWSWATQPPVPKFDPAVQQRLVEDSLEKLTPAQSWDLWLHYRQLAETGFPVFEASNRAEIERQIVHRQSIRKLLCIVAGIFAAVAATAAFWPSAGKTRRQGDKETTRAGG
jgi:hypothetical protein